MSLECLYCFTPLVCCFAQTSESDILDQVKPTVVKIGVAIHKFQENPLPLDPSAQQCFAKSENNYCLVGSGIFVNRNGDVVTASHVATAALDIVQKLRQNGIDAGLAVGALGTNVDDGNHTYSNSTINLPATIIAVDTTHDLAVMHSGINPFTNMPKFIKAPGFPPIVAKTASLEVRRIRDAEQIFACGFPLSSVALVTTTGTIASVVE